MPDEERDEGRDEGRGSGSPARALFPAGAGQGTATAPQSSGRLEGAAAVVAAGTILNFLGWIPTVLVLAVAGYLIYRFVLKPRKSSDPPASSEEDLT